MFRAKHRTTAFQVLFSPSFLLKEPERAANCSAILARPDYTRESESDGSLGQIMQRSDAHLTSWLAFHNFLLFATSESVWMYYRIEPKSEKRLKPHGNRRKRSIRSSDFKVIHEYPPFILLAIERIHRQQASWRCSFSTGLLERAKSILKFFDLKCSKALELSDLQSNREFLRLYSRRKVVAICSPHVGSPTRSLS